MSVLKWFIPFTLGLLGMLVGLVAWHSYNDHVLFHNLVNAVSQQLQSQQNQGEAK